MRQEEKVAIRGPARERSGRGHWEVWLQNSFEGLVSIRIAEVLKRKGKERKEFGTSV
jgi:hypothetical protein